MTVPVGPIPSRRTGTLVDLGDAQRYLFNEDTLLDNASVRFLQIYEMLDLIFHQSSRGVVGPPGLEPGTNRL